MRKVSLKIVGLASILIFGAVLFFGFLAKAQQLPLKPARPPAVQTGPVFLNDQRVGTLANLLPLKTKISKIMNDRLENGVFRASTGEPELRVLLDPGPRISVVKVAALFDAINSGNGEVFVPRYAPPQGDDLDVKPNPLTLVVRTEPLTDTDVISPPEDNTAFPIYFFVGPSLTDLKVARLDESGIEVSDTGSYLINDRAKDFGNGLSPLSNINYGANHMLDRFTVHQRPIDVSKLDAEIADLYKRRLAETAAENERVEKAEKALGIPRSPSSGERPEPITLRVIISEKEPYSSLIPIFKAARNLNVSFRVLVRK